MSSVPIVENWLYPGIRWFAYYDSEDKISRAVCYLLGLVVERPTISDAVKELKVLIEDQVRTSRERKEDFARPLPNDIYSEHLRRSAPNPDSNLWQDGWYLV